MGKENKRKHPKAPLLGKHYPENHPEWYPKPFTWWECRVLNKPEQINCPACLGDRSKDCTPCQGFGKVCSICKESSDFCEC